MKMLSSGTFSQTESEPQKIVNQLLDAMGVLYDREYLIGTYSVDNYLTHYGLCIEVMGDFWHTSPRKYASPMYSQQRLAMSRDIIKRQLIREVTGVFPLYLWESDIVTSPETCAALITKYISESGMLLNYNSFNYVLCDGELLLAENLLIPFQEIDTDQLL